MMVVEGTYPQQGVSKGITCFEGPGGFFKKPFAPWEPGQELTVCHKRNAQDTFTTRC